MVPEALVCATEVSGSFTFKDAEAVVELSEKSDGAEVARRELITEAPDVDAAAVDADAVSSGLENKLEVCWVAGACTGARVAVGAADVAVGAMENAGEKKDMPA